MAIRAVTLGLWGWTHRASRNRLRCDDRSPVQVHRNILVILQLVIIVKIVGIAGIFCTHFLKPLFLFLLITCVSTVTFLESFFGADKVVLLWSGCKLEVVADSERALAIAAELPPSQVSPLAARLNCPLIFGLPALK